MHNHLLKSRCQALLSVVGSALESLGDNGSRPYFLVRWVLTVARQGIHGGGWLELKAHRGLSFSLDYCQPALLLCHMQFDLLWFAQTPPLSQLIKSAFLINWTKIGLGLVLFSNGSNFPRQWHSLIKSVRAENTDTTLLRSESRWASRELERRMPPPHTNPHCISSGMNLSLDVVVC